MMDYRGYCTDDRLEFWADGDELINDRTNELMSQGQIYDDCSFDNILEFIGSATTEEVESMEEHLRNKDFEKFGRLVWSISYNYCKKFAEDTACSEYEDGKLND